MSRFDAKRAEAFATYALTALVRDAGESGKVFVRLSRSTLADALKTKKLYEEHIERVRSKAGSEGIGMANLGHEFLFFNASDKISADAPSADYVVKVTDKFSDVFGSVAADKLWDDQSYRPKALTTLPARQGTAKKGAVFPAIRTRG